jgi:hypothetical protein
MRADYIRTDDADLYGWASESAVMSCLNRLRRDELIDGYIKCPKNGHHDKTGVDYRIIIRKRDGNGFEIPLQVKSSEYYLNEHLSRPGRYIPAVNGQSETLFNDLLSIINSYKETPGEAQRTEEKCLESFISCTQAAEWAGLKNGAMYKIIRNRKLHAVVEEVSGLKLIKIPTEAFLKWLDKEINRAEDKLKLLKRSHKEVKEYIKGK